MSDAADKLTRAKSRIIFYHPWWASLIMRLNVVDATGDPRVPTAATDGASLFYNRDFVADLSQDEVDFLVAHEGLHCGFQHHLRRHGREQERWNVACDHAINLILIETGMTMPKDGLADKKYAGLSSEEIYNKLPKSCGQPFGWVLDGVGGNSQDRQWREAMTEAMHAALKAGRLPSSAERLLVDAISEKINWRSLLASLLTRCVGRDDYTWSRPSRRSVAADGYLPSTFAERARPLSICIDTSGSMSERIIGEIVAEARSALIQLRPTNTVIISADAAVQSVEIISADEDFNPRRLRGGGGTDFVPAVREAEKHDPCAIVYLTDLDGSFPQSATAPIFWVSSNKSVKPPFGEVIFHSTDEE
jgi:predicted metal-dependent peptidase